MNQLNKNPNIAYLETSHQLCSSESVWKCNRGSVVSWLPSLRVCVGGSVVGRLGTVGRPMRQTLKG